MLHPTEATEKFRRGVSPHPLPQHVSCKPSSSETSSLLLLQTGVLPGQPGSLRFLCPYPELVRCRTTTQAAQRSHPANQRHTHTRFLAAVESRGFFFSVGSVCTVSKQQALAAGIPVLTWMALEMSRGKAESARVGCRFIPALIYSSEFHNNFSNSE